MKSKKLLYICILILFFVSFLFSIGCAKKEQADISKEATDTEETTMGKSTIDEETEEETPQWKESLDEATKLYKEGDFGEVKKLLKEVLKMDPDNKVSKEMIEKANDFIMQAIEHFNNATKLFYEKKMDEAIDELKKAIDIYPKYKEALDILEELGLLDELNIENE